MKKFDFSDKNAFFSKLAAVSELFIPQDNGAGAEFLLWKDGAKLSDKLNTRRSAKDFFFPQTENMMDFVASGKMLEIKDIREECEDFVIFGVRACDAKSFDILDSVFLSDPVDTYYKNRREHGVVITLACTEPEETCFCRNFGIDPARPAGDISSWIAGNEIYLEANTEKGEKFLSKLGGTDCGKEKVEEQQAETEKIVSRLPLNGLPTEKFTADRLMEIFNDPKWKELSRECLGCGTCTFVCPTCQCFDIKDFDTGHGIKRFRCWDSCMYSDFTKMAAANPRLTQTERFRQRFMHKLVYYPANNNGVFGCVGCGRCLSACPISMNIVKVIKETGGKN